LGFNPINNNKQINSHIVRLEDLSNEFENTIKVKSAKTKVAPKSATVQTKNSITSPDNNSSETKFANEFNYSVINKNSASVEKNKAVSSKYRINEISQRSLKNQLDLLSILTDKKDSIENGVVESNKEISKSSTENEIKNVESLIENEVVQVLDSSKIIDSVLTNQTVEKVELTKGKKKLSLTKEIGFFSGVSGIISSFDIPKELENSLIASTISEYRETREREEVSTTSWDFSLRMKWVINGFSLQTGLDYFQWGEEIRYDYNSISGINRYSYLNIPINLGYAKTWNKFGLNPFAGVMFGYGLNRTGNYLQTDLMSIAQAESKKYLVNYQIGCEVYFLSDSQFKFSLIPVYRASFKEVVFTDLIRNRYKSIGLQLGISYNF
jgi:hypothetical protein